MTTPAGLGLIEYLALGGTANGAMTDTAGYASGVTTIILAPIGTGKINDNQIIQFEGDNRGYLVQTGVADVSLGGTLVLKTPLRQDLPHSAVKIRAGNELRRGWGHNAYHPLSGYLDGNAPAMASDWYQAGDVAQIWLDYRYAKLDHKHKDNRTESVATSKVVQIRDLGSEERYIVSQKFVEDLRAAGVASDMDSFESFVDNAMKGGAFLWFPDFENYPDEFLSCILNKRAEPVRSNKIGNFNYDFDLRVLPSVQIPSSSPAFI